MLLAERHRWNATHHFCSFTDKYTQHIDSHSDTDWIQKGFLNQQRGPLNIPSWPLMPKKRNYNFRNLEGSSSGKANASNNATDKASTVNERLSELRRLEGKDAAKKKAELAQLSQTPRSVLPPELSAMLGLPQSAPPKPKRGVRSRMPDRTPGPPPPTSWRKTPGWSRVLALRNGTRRFKKAAGADHDRSRPKQLMRFARMTGEETGRLDQRPPSLLHLALKCATESWHLFDAEDLPMLAEMPLPLRLRLLSYLGFYGPSIDINVVDALTKDRDPVLGLDLAGLIGHGSLAVSKLVKLAKQQPSSEKLEAASNDIAESWDQEETHETALSRTTLTTRFSQLAPYWPRPTLTPNLATATVSSQNSPDVTAGGSHFYSAMDEDMYEPASILRTLSSNLLRLTWLDLEGCTEWMPALAFHQDANATKRQHDIQEGDEWTAISAVTSMFIKNWTNLTYINCAQGWLPSMSAMLSLPRRTMPYMHRRIMAKFEETQDAASLTQADAEEPPLVAQQKAEKWLDLEDRAFATERRINALRRTSNVKQVDFDHGWDKDNSLVLTRST
ncbi:hypothetical protein AC578_89 [Pseudocercospora eumusae]|uniref:Uncharacterized protein n=1 Tax=Pseudocercospora eumusae TaxID=321146 RepID=A0A139HPB2_9PEZI|nr:hypothetical protein AC578_89 [Pseudocercospora eumusae]